MSQVASADADDEAVTMARQRASDIVFSVYGGVVASDRVAQLLADAGLLCTPDEREYLDDINRPPTPEERADGRAAWERFEAMRAVVAAAKAETKAEEAALGNVLAAMTVRSGSPRQQAAQQAASELKAAKAARRTAVTTLNQLEAQT